MDDLLWAVTPEYAKHVEVILREFEINESKRKRNDFRFCGKQVTRYDNGDIFVSCKDGIECIGPVKFSAEGRKQEDPATPAEIGQMRSVVGSLGWVARQCMPISSYAVSRGQGVVTKAKLKDLKDINQALEQAMEYSDRGLLFKANGVSWDNAIAVIVSDASFAGETIVEADGKEKPHRTQKAFMVLLVSPEILNKDEASSHIWCYRSLTDKRVCRATL